jgi:hypothetical protein
VLANDTPGADGVTDAHVAYVNGTLTGAGSLVYNNDGTFTYTPTAGEDGDVTFQYTITDGDGDPSTATVTIHLAADSTPIPGDSTATVDDDGLAGGLAGGVGDIDATVGSSPATATETAYSGTLSVDFGGDGGTVSFANLDGTTGTVGTESVLYSWNAGTNTLTAVTTDGDRVGTELFKVVVNPTTGAYTVTLEDNILHTSGGNETSASIDLHYLATDGDNDTSADGKLTITFNDDTPSAFATEAVGLDNDTGSVTGSLDTGDGNLNNNLGADGGKVQFPSSLDGSNSGLTSGGQPILYDISADGQTLYGMVGADVIFTITLDQGASTYQVEMSGHVDSFTHVDFNNGSYNFIGGNDPWGGFSTAANDDSQDLLVTPMMNGVSDGTFNSSSISGGVGSGNSVGAGEGIRLDYVVDLHGDPAKTGGSGDYSDGVNQDQLFDGHYTTNGASADFTATGGSTVKIEAFDDADGNTAVGDGGHDDITAVAISYAGGPVTLIVANGTYLVDGHSYTVTFNGDGTVDVAGVYGTSGAGAEATTIAAYTADGYNSLEFTYDGGETFKIGNFGASIQSSDPVNFTVPVEIVDGDGDVAAGTPLDITLDPSASSTFTLSTMSVSSVSSQSSSMSTTSLLSSNDNGEQRSSSGGQSAVLMGAVAAVGLSTLDVQPEHHDAPGPADHSPAMEPLQSAGVAAVSAEPASIAETTPALAASSHWVAPDAVQHSTPLGEAAAHAGTLANDGAGLKEATSELLHGTDGHLNGHAAHATSVTAAAVAMPSAEQLAAVSSGGPEQPASAVAGELAQHDQVVGKILADALHGGASHGPNIDALINGLPGHDGAATDALQALASHADGAVSFGHMGFGAAFGGGHAMLSMEMVMHDAAAAHG